MPWACPYPPFLPLLLLGPHQTQESHCPRTGAEEVQPFLQVPGREIQSSGARWETPFGQPLLGHGSPQSYLLLHPEPPSSTGTSSPQPICQVRSQVHGFAGARSFFPPIPTHSSKLLPRGWSPRPRATVLGKFGSPSPLLPRFPHPPLTWLETSKEAIGELRPGLQPCFDGSVIPCPLG